MMEYVAMLPGQDFENLRQYANKELIKQGIKQPETPDEINFMQSLQQQPQQPDPAQIAAQAEMVKGQAEQANAEVRMFDAQTKRAKVEIEASKAGVEMEKINEDIASARLDNMEKLAQRLRPAPITPPLGFPG